MRKQRIGILTGGGDCAGLNAVIRAITKHSILTKKAEVIGIRYGFEGLIHNDTVSLTYDSVSGILARSGTILGTSNKGNPFVYGPAHENVSRKVLENYKKLKLDSVICVGGEGTMEIAHNLMRIGINVVGVPKTIDNDVWGTDYTFGFNTAYTIAASLMQQLAGTADAHGRIMIVETMGRRAGWIALYAGIASGADVVIIPEVAWSLDAVTHFIIERHKRRRFTVISFAESARPKDVDKGQFSDLGISTYIAKMLERMTGYEARAMILGHLQRSAFPTPFDRVLATRYGYAASKNALSRKFGVMVALNRDSIVNVPISKVAGKYRYVNSDHHLIETGRATGVCFGDK